MKGFDRRLWTNGLVGLRNLTCEPGGNWWKDLLSHWCPSGVPSGEQGLRLAVRNGYLNLYRSGQSIARISRAHDGRPFAKLHHKYVDDAATGQSYVRLIGSEFKASGDSAARSYIGRDMLREWINRSRNHHGGEKIGVDLLVGCNPEVIDLEMGLPANKERKSALRMDLVALERRGDAILIVFWEAKRIDDPRLRARGRPEILTQIEGYRDYMADQLRRRRVIEAYRDACGIMCELHDIARTIAPIEDLAPIIHDTATAPMSSLDVDPTPRLVVFDDPNRRASKAWPEHEKKLRDEGVHVVIANPATCRLSSTGVPA